MRDMGNFHGYMPEGYMRRIYQGRDMPDKVKSIVSTIDQYLEEIHFDRERYSRLHKIMRKLWERSSTLLLSGETERSEHYGRRHGKLREICQSIEGPVFDYLVEHGFDSAFLCQ